MRNPSLRRALCFVLGGHDLGIVPVFEGGRARLRCQLGCGYVTAGIDVPKHDEPKKPVVQRWTRSRYGARLLAMSGRRG
jgi:hypothetical protein